jgi:hypothetical protein
MKGIEVGSDEEKISKCNPMILSLPSNLFDYPFLRNRSGE